MPRYDLTTVTSFPRSLLLVLFPSYVQDDDVRKYVIARKFEKKGKTVTKRPHIQRLITPIRLQRKRARAAAKKVSQAKSQRDASEYARCV